MSHLSPQKNVKTMTLSQIIAKDSYYDVEIPEAGMWKVRVVIQDGKVTSQDVTEQRKKEKVKK